MPNSKDRRASLGILSNLPSASTDTNVPKRSISYNNTNSSFIRGRGRGRSFGRPFGSNNGITRKISVNEYKQREFEKRNPIRGKPWESFQSNKTPFDGSQSDDRNNGPF